LICEIAVATHTVPSQWVGEDMSTILTVVDVLRKRG
jgi:hypothetical protein